MNSYLVTVTVLDPDTGKYNIDICTGKDSGTCKTHSHKAARQMGACYITDLTAERRFNDEH